MSKNTVKKYLAAEEPVVVGIRRLRRTSRLSYTVSRSTTDTVANDTSLKNWGHSSLRLTARVYTGTDSTPRYGQAG